MIIKYDVFAHSLFALILLYKGMSLFSTAWKKATEWYDNIDRKKEEELKLQQENRCIRSKYRYPLQQKQEMKQERKLFPQPPPLAVQSKYHATNTSIPEKQQIAIQEQQRKINFIHTYKQFQLLGSEKIDKFQQDLQEAR